MWKLTRKGQLEIMGLVVVVILVSLGMLFLLKFVVLSPAGEEKAVFTRDRMATGAVNAWLITSTDCHVTGDMTDLTKECVEQPDNRCNNDEPVCDFLTRVTEKMLDKTLGEWKKTYQLEIKVMGAGGIKKSIENGQCTGDKDASKPYPLSSKRGTILIQLFICD